VRPLSFPSFGGDRDQSAEGGTSRSSARVPAAELEALRQAARAEGFEAGAREGRARAHAEWSGRLSSAVQALEAACRTLLACRVELAAEVERQLPAVVFTLTRKILQQELAVSQTAAQTAIRSVTERLAGCERPVVVRLGHEAMEAFEAWRRSDAGAAAGAGVRIELDRELGPGDWVVQTGDGFLDGRVESQLDEAWRLVTELPR
jgi:flagellar assembly protein FliH